MDANNVIKTLTDEGKTEEEICKIICDAKVIASKNLSTRRLNAFVIKTQADQDAKIKALVDLLSSTSSSNTIIGALQAGVIAVPGCETECCK